MMILIRQRTLLLISLVSLAAISFGDDDILPANHGSTQEEQIKIHDHGPTKTDNVGDTNSQKKPHVYCERRQERERRRESGQEEGDVNPRIVFNCIECPIGKGATGCAGDCRWDRSLHICIDDNGIDDVSCGDHDAAFCGDCEAYSSNTSACSGDCRWDHGLGACVPPDKLDLICRNSCSHSDHTNKVNCGNHDADTCTNCPKEGSASGCAGECMWDNLNKVCVPDKGDDSDVNCGDHDAASCGDCEAGNADKSGCAGECRWIEDVGACVKPIDEDCIAQCLQDIHDEDENADEDADVDDCGGRGDDGDGDKDKPVFAPLVDCGSKQESNCSMCSLYANGVFAKGCAGQCMWDKVIQKCVDDSGIPNVNCGDHDAASCDKCQATAEDASGCSGDCFWVDDSCSSGPSVDCGDHKATSCGKCPSGKGPTGCVGECMWDGVAKSCIPDNPENPDVDCGGYDAVSCSDCFAGRSDTSGCAGQCTWSDTFDSCVKVLSDDECSIMCPKLQSMTDFAKEFHAPKPVVEQEVKKESLPESDIIETDAELKTKAKESVPDLETKESIREIEPETDITESDIELNPKSKEYDTPKILSELESDIIETEPKEPDDTQVSSELKETDSVPEMVSESDIKSKIDPELESKESDASNDPMSETEPESDIIENNIDPKSVPKEPDVPKLSSKQEREQPAHKVEPESEVKSFPMVDCGSHYANRCDNCANEKEGCSGDCKWIATLNKCVPHDFVVINCGYGKQALTCADCTSHGEGKPTGCSGQCVWKKSTSSCVNVNRTPNDNDDIAKSESESKPPVISQCGDHQATSCGECGPFDASNKLRLSGQYYTNTYNPDKHEILNCSEPIGPYGRIDMRKMRGDHHVPKGEVSIQVFTKPDGDGSGSGSGGDLMQRVENHTIQNAALRKKYCSSAHTKYPAQVQAAAPGFKRQQWLPGYVTVLSPSEFVFIFSDNTMQMPFTRATEAQKKKWT